MEISSKTVVSSQYPLEQKELFIFISPSLSLIMHENSISTLPNDSMYIMYIICGTLFRANI